MLEVKWHKACWWGRHVVHLMGVLQGTEKQKAGVGEGNGHCCRVRQEGKEQVCPQWGHTRNYSWPQARQGKARQLLWGGQGGGW